MELMEDEQKEKLLYIKNKDIQSRPPVNWWLAQPLEGAITGLTPERGTELYYRITCTTTRKRVKTRYFFI